MSACLSLIFVNWKAIARKKKLKCSDLNLQIFYRKRQEENKNDANEDTDGSKSAGQSEKEEVDEGKSHSW